MDNKDYITAKDPAHAFKPANGLETIRILIVDDQTSVRKAVRMRLAAEADLLVIGEAPNGEAALDLVVELHPDVVLMDVEMPCSEGIGSTSEFRERCPESLIIVLSFNDDARTRARARDAGAAGFVSKSEPPDTLPRTIRQVFWASLGQGQVEHGTLPTWDDASL